MKDYESIILSLLNLNDNDISSISSSGQNIFLKLASSSLECPYCRSSLTKSIGYYTKKINVANDVFDNFSVSVSVPRRLCHNCHHSFSESKTISPPKSKSSYKTVINLMKLLESPSMTFREAARITSVSVTTAVRLFDKHVKVSRSPLPEVICVDEVYTKNTDYKNGKFSFLIYDFDSQKLVDVVPSRKKFELYRYFESIDSKERDNVKYISMDMYPVYKMVAQKYLKKAIICVDSFHVIKHLNDDLSKIRIRTMKQFDTSSNEYYLLKNFNFLLFDEHIDLDGKGRYNKKIGRIINYRGILDMMLNISDDLYKGYNLKVRYSRFSKDIKAEHKSYTLNELIKDFTEANIAEFEEFTTLLKNWKEEILNSFSTYNGKRINNSIAESMNVKVSTLLYITRGIRNHERRRKRILYCINKSGFNLR